MTDFKVKTVPPEIDRPELLGRQEWSERQAARMVRQQDANRPLNVPKNNFKPPVNSNTLSVDRMDYAERNELRKLAEKNIRENQAFQGWYIVCAADVMDLGCDVQASQSPQHPYHADIIIPTDPNEFDPKAIKDNQIKFALKIAQTVRKFVTK
ncbi:MAG: hypothetical protein OXD38_05650 [Aestuariivita sp.]|nr:hypothetical protein [Aestuariivita sp.]